MAKQSNNLEELIRTSLEEAKKKAYGKKREEEEEGEEEEEEEEEESSKSKKKMEEEVEAVEESTTAASSIAAKGDAKAPIKHAPDTDQNHFNATMAQYGSNKDHGVPDNSAKNSATIDSKLGKGPKTKDAMPKLNVKEDLEPMFDGEDLSEDFKEKAATLFEAAISARMAAETARLEEEFEAKVQEELSVFQEELTTKIDAYLDYGKKRVQRHSGLPASEDGMIQLVCAETAIAIDAIINQRGGDVHCFYVAIGQKKSTVVEVYESLRRHGAMAYTTIVCASAAEPAPMQFIAPYSGVTMAEYYRDSGRHSLVPLAIAPDMPVLTPDDIMAGKRPGAGPVVIFDDDHYYMGGVCAESAAASVLFFVSSKGIPVSTTHTITGAIVGVGSANRRCGS